MAKDIQKELNTNVLKKSLDFNNKYSAVEKEIKQLQNRKEAAAKEVVSIKNALAHLITDVEVLTDESKRKAVLARQAELNAQLAEAELFTNMDIASYKAKKLDELHDLGSEVMKEYADFNKKVDDLLDEYQKEYEDNKNLILSIRNTNISNLALKRASDIKLKRTVRLTEEQRANNANNRQTVYVMTEDGTLIEKSQADKTKEQGNKKWFGGIGAR